MRPQQIKKPATNTDNRIQPGRVVEYLQHGKTNLGIIQQQRKERWVILNQENAEFELGADRLELLPGTVPDGLTTSKQRAEFLKQLKDSAAKLCQSHSLADAWEVLSGESSEVNLSDLVELLFNSTSLEVNVATRQMLSEDIVYFKKKKSGTYEPRPEEVVVELRRQAEVEREKRQIRETMLGALAARLKDPLNAELPDVSALEIMAAIGKSAPEAKEGQALLDELIERTGVSLPGNHFEKAFELLVKLGHFTVHENLIPLRMGRPTAFSVTEKEEASRLAEALSSTFTEDREDLADLLSFTIDGDETRDFDDALSLERTPTGYRVGIHISDVASLIPEDSIIDKAATRRASSIYCPDQHLPMLPEVLSQNALSLVAGEKRPVVSHWIELNSDFQIVSRRLKRSVLKTTQRITYHQADAILCDDHPDESDLHVAIHTLFSFAEKSEQRRKGAGAMQFSRKEMSPIIDETGRVRLEEYDEETPARKLVSEMMVIANETAASFASDNGLALIFRAQEAPETDLSDGGLDIPEGPARDFFRRSMFKRSTTGTKPLPHFGLGLSKYAQVTSPMRRAIDLLNQRQLCCFLVTGQAKYSEEKLNEKYIELSAGLEETALINKERTRYWILQYLVQERIKELEATILKADGPRPLAEVDMLCALFQFQVRDPALRAKIRPGDRITLDIEQINPRKDTFLLQLKQIH